MDEASRFIRFVVPGFSSVFFIAALLVLTDNNRVKAAIDDPRSDAASAIAGGVAVFFASGAFGYLMSVLHHVLYWNIYSRCQLLGWSADLRSFIQDGATPGHLKVVSAENGEEVKYSDLTPFDAWALMNAVWHFRKGTSKGLRAAEHRSQTLFDIMHGAGSLFVSWAFASVIWLAIEIQCSAGWTWWTTNALLLVDVPLGVLLMCNMHTSARAARRVTETMFSMYLEERRWHVSPRDPGGVVVVRYLGKDLSFWQASLGQVIRRFLSKAGGLSMATVNLIAAMILWRNPPR